MNRETQAILCLVFIRASNNFGLASNVSLVESESGVPLILLVGELVNSNLISASFFKCRTIFFFTAECRTPEIRHGAWRTLSPVKY